MSDFKRFNENQFAGAAFGISVGAAAVGAAGFMRGLERARAIGAQRRAVETRRRALMAVAVERLRESRSVERFAQAELMRAALALSED